MGLSVEDVQVPESSSTRLDSDLWAAPVVVHLVWSLILVVSTSIVLSCLRSETKKVGKLLDRAGAERQEPVVNDVSSLRSMMGRYVQLSLCGLSPMERLADRLTRKVRVGEVEVVREQVRNWFREKCEQLAARNYTEKEVRRRILAAVKRGLTNHPLDLRGSRRAMEAAMIFLEVDDTRQKVSFLDTNLTIGKADQVLEAGGGGGGGGGAAAESPSFVCPTMACQWMAAALLRVCGLAVSHPNTVPLFFVFLSFVIWLYDCITDMVIIEMLWSFQLPLLYPVEGEEGETSNLSYQTLTVDLYAPLLLLILLFSLMFSLLSCSCSRLSDQYRLSSSHSRPQEELSSRVADPTTVLARYDFQVSQACTASLPQFVLQFSAYLLVLYMLETLKSVSEEQAKVDIQAKIDNFSFRSLWFSAVGSGLSLSVAQYTAFKIQHEHDMTLGQRCVYFLACVSNTFSMMICSLVFCVLLLLPCSTYIGRHHIMIIVILGCALLGVASLVSITLASFHLEASSLPADRVVTKVRGDSLLPALLRFGVTSPGQWATLLGAVTLLGKVVSLATVSLFLAPSQLLIHPFYRFYTSSPRSPALHYAIAKQLITYNLLHVLSSLLLVIDITQFGFNHGLSSATRNLLVFSNITVVPCIFLAFLILFKFYTSHDLWTSHGAHLVFMQDLPTVICSGEEEDPEVTDPEVTVIQEAGDIEDRENSEPEANNEMEKGEQTDTATAVGTGEEDTATPLNTEHEDAAEADRNQLTPANKLRNVTIQKTRKVVNRKLRGTCCSLVTDLATVDVTHGRWVDLSD